MKKKGISRYLKFIAPLLSAAIIPTVLSSCSATTTTNVKVLDVSNWNNGEVSYATLNSTNVSLESSVYGSNYNDGNYILLWGSLANSSITSFLFGNTTPSIPYEENDFNQSVFFNAFFNSILVDGSLGYSVSFLMYLDVPTYNEDANTLTNALSGYNLPTDKFTIDEVLNIYNDGLTNGKYSDATLPLAAQAMVDNYKRNDQSAVTYREFIQYVQQLRPSLTSASDGGIIAFRNSKNPESFSVSDSTDTLISSLITYYTPTADDD